MLQKEKENEKSDTARTRGGCGARRRLQIVRQIVLMTGRDDRMQSSSSGLKMDGLPCLKHLALHKNDK